MGKLKKIVVEYCTSCGARKGESAARFCIRCGRPFDVSSTALSTTLPSGVQHEVGGLEFIANDLARFEGEWRRNRELIRRTDWLWGFIGRDLSTFGIRRRIKEMQGELEKMDERTYLGKQALDRQHYLRRQRSQATLNIADEEIRAALLIFDRQLDLIDAMVTRRQLSEPVREHLTMHLINELILKRLQSVVASGQSPRDSVVTKEVQDMMAKQLMVFTDEEGDSE